MARKQYESQVSQSTSQFVSMQKGNETTNKELSTSKVVEPVKEKKVIEVAPVEKVEIPIENVQPVQMVDEMAFSLPRSGRPKTLDGKYHTFTARLREDLYEYAKSSVGDGKQYQSVNDYINRLIARDMLSNR